MTAFMRALDTTESSLVRATIRYAVAAARITSKAKRARTELMVVLGMMTFVESERSIRSLAGAETIA